MTLLALLVPGTGGGGGTSGDVVLESSSERGTTGEPVASSRGSVGTAIEVP
jgi:hypothetical protein